MLALRFRAAGHQELVMAHHHVVDMATKTSIALEHQLECGAAFVGAFHPVVPAVDPDAIPVEYGLRRGGILSVHRRDKMLHNRLARPPHTFWLPQEMESGQRLTPWTLRNRNVAAELRTNAGSYLQPTISSGLKKKSISIFAFSSLSEP